MEISIDCGVFARLANLARLSGDGWLRSIWLEVKDGKAIAVATDRKIMAIEFLGEDVGPDFSLNAVVDDGIFNQCNVEKPFGSKITYTLNHETGFITAMTTLGYTHSSNGALRDLPGENVLERWRDCLPDALPVASNGGMFSSMDRLATLASTAPSGVVIFPEFIDVNKPVVVNDVHDPNWLGLFMSKADTQEDPDPVEIPSWAR